MTELKDGLLGAQVGTTSLDAITNVIKPTTEPRVYDTNDPAITALNAKQIDGDRRRPPDRLLHDRRRLENGTIVGQFPGDRQRRPSTSALVLAKDSPLTACVNAAIDGARRGWHARRSATQWLPSRTGAASSSRRRATRPRGAGPKARGDRPAGPVVAARIERARARRRAIAVVSTRRRLRRARAGSSSTRPAGRRSGRSFFNAEVFGESCRPWSARSGVNIQLFLLAEVADPALRAGAGGAAQPARPGVLPAPVRWPTSTSTSSGPCRASWSSSCSASASRRCACRRTDRAVLLGVVALTLVYSAYVAEVYRAGIESVHPSARGGRPVARAVAAARRCATWSCRRRSAGSSRRCSTTSSGCRRTRRWCRSSASSRSSGRRRSSSRRPFNFTPYVGVRADLHRAHDPDGAVRRLAGRARPAAARPAGGRVTLTAMRRGACAIEGLHKSFGDARGAARHRPDVGRARGRVPDRRVRARASRRCCAASTCSSRSTPGRILVDGAEITADGRRRRPHPAPDRDRVPGVQPVPAHDRARQRHARRRARCCKLPRAEAEAQAHRAARAVRAGRQARRVPRPAVGRPAAAGGDRPGAGDAAGPPAARRDHQRARPRAGRRGARRHPRAGRRRA